ncbi:MAG: hypothetical protein WCP69_11210 [Bacteroidota bacterium]
MNCISNYDVKILMALSEALKGKRKFADWFVANGYPELAAFSAAVNSNEEALHWLISKSKHPELGVLSNAIDDEQNALMWLRRYNAELMFMFAKACRKDDKAVMWFVSRDLKALILLIKTIQEIIQKQIDDAADVHKIRRS